MSNIQLPARVLRRLGENIRELRAQRGLTQDELSYSVGLNRSNIWAIERGERNLTVRTLYGLAEALGVGIADLFRGV